VHAASKNKKSEPKKDKEQLSPPTVWVSTDDKAEQASTNTKGEQDIENYTPPFRVRVRQHFTFERLTFYVGCIVAVLTFILIFYTKDQVNATYEQTAEMRKTSRRELKAYVNISSMPDSSEIIKQLKGDGVKFYIKNFGQTPAYNVTVGSIFTVDDSENIPNPDTISVENEYRIVLPPTAESVSFPLALGGRGQRDNRMWMAGRIRYIDVFMDTTYVTFRYMYVSLHNRFFAYTRDNHEETKPNTTQTAP
jgi:hypothetical protein